MSYSKLTIVGNLGQDPEMRYTPDGTPVTNFSVATNRKYKTAAGADVEETTWYRITAWRQLGELCNQYLSKGRQVLVEGRLTPDENGGPRVWTGNDGQARASFEVNALTVRFLGGANGSAAPPAGEAPPELGEDEIPF